MTRLAGKAALVTGASRGIGKAIALRLAADGAVVVVNFVGNEQGARDTAKEIEAKGGRAAILQGDVTQASNAAALLQGAEAAFGGLDILVNNAGVAIMTAFADLTEADYDRLFGVTKGVYFLMQEASRRLRDGGRIVSLSTGLTRNWAPRAAAYAASKAAIEQFSRSLSKEVGARGITVNVVLPGVTTTGMTEDFPLNAKQHAERMSSFGRLGAPEDIADIVAFLASDDARWITGQLLVANGGTTP